MLLSARASGAPVASIEFDYVPPFGSFNDLTGLVRNANPTTHRVAVYIYVGGGWWTKPNGAAPLTTIATNSTWTCDITTGGIDEQATKIAAFIVRTNYTPPVLLGVSALPGDLASNAVAQVAVTRADPSVRTLTFSGVDWWVKGDTNLLGPGPNYFSTSTNNVWLDASNRLHLRVTHTNGQWRCAEVVSQKTFGYGQYRFQLDSPVDNLDRNLVLGLFTWTDDPAFTHRELDFEFSRWGNAADTNNAQFVVQPFDLTNHLVRYQMPTGQPQSTHVFDWHTNQVFFQSLRGLQGTNLPPTNVISQSTYTQAVPPSGDENVRLNLWLFNGAAPNNGQEAEIVIRQFEFIPADSDGDGIPDTWEIQHGFNPNDPSDAGLDTDGDGQSNLKEFLAGTDPRSANSVLRICNAQRLPGAFTLSFNGTTGQTYHVSYRDGFSAGSSWTNWTNLPAPAFDRLLSVTNVFAPAVSNRIYRVTTP